VGEPAADFTLDTASLLASEEHEVSIVGRSPWYLAWRRLRRNKVAFAFLALFVLIIVACALAPVYASQVAKTTPNANHVTDRLKVGNTFKDVISAGGTYVDPKTNQIRVRSSIPIGPQWFAAGGRFVLGADQNGRDEAVRLLYGGRNSLLIGIGSSLICTLVAVLLALLAGYYGGWVDWIITRFFDLSFAFPVILLAIALGSALAINGFHHFGLTIQSGSLWIPTLVISYVLVPYVGRPLRGQVLALREKEFIEAATSQGAGPIRIMFAELLPNIASSVLVFFTLIIAGNIITEASLSFLGAGVQPPNPSWGTLISEGQELLTT
jgi:peptide/nickel transport system permease protein